MPEFSKIDEFNDWINNQSQRTRAAFSARLALRALPMSIHIPPLTPDTEPFLLAFLRSTLIAAIVSRFPNLDATEMVTHSRQQINHVAGLVDTDDPVEKAKLASGIRFGGIAYNALECLRWSTAAPRRSRSILEIGSPAGHIDSSYDILIVNTFEDARYRVADILDQRLWMSSERPPKLLELTAQNPNILESKEKWDFWRRWYEGFLEGKPIDWELQLRVALIPNGDWDKGPDSVTARINEIEAEYLSELAQLSEEITIDPISNKFIVVPVPLENEELITSLMIRVSDAIEDALTGSNGLREESHDVRKLRRTNEKYSQDPQQIELNYSSAALSLRRQIFETSELAESADNLTLLEAVEDGVRAIRALHPSIAANRKLISRQRLRELGQDDLDILNAARPVLVAISDGILAEDFDRDIPKLINDATLPLPSGAPPLPGADEATRIFSRISKIQRLREKMKAGAFIHDSDAFKTTVLSYTVGSILFGLVKLGLRLFGVL